MRQPTTSPRQVHAAERRLFVLELRRGGVTYHQIARRVRAHYGPAVPSSYDARHACKDVHRMLRQLQTETAEAAEVVRRLELERLDELQLAVWPQARAGDLQAIACVLRIMEKRSRLLRLDAPMQVAPTSLAGTPLADSPALTPETLVALLAMTQAQPDPPD